MSDKSWFTGLASPPAAAAIASTVWVAHDLGWVGDAIPYEVSILVAVLTGVIGFMMIINVPYYSFKTLDANRRVPFASIILLVIVISLVTVDPPLVLMSVSLVYAISGPLMLLRGRKATTAVANGSKDEEE